MIIRFSCTHKSILPGEWQILWNYFYGNFSHFYWRFPSVKPCHPAHRLVCWGEDPWNQKPPTTLPWPALSHQNQTRNFWELGAFIFQSIKHKASERRQGKVPEANGSLTGHSQPPPPLSSSLQTEEFCTSRLSPRIFSSLTIEMDSLLAKPSLGLKLHWDKYL